MNCLLSRACAKFLGPYPVFIAIDSGRADENRPPPESRDQRIKGPPVAVMPWTINAKRGKQDRIRVARNEVL